MTIGVYFLLLLPGPHGDPRLVSPLSDQEPIQGYEAVSQNQLVPQFLQNVENLLLRGKAVLHYSWKQTSREQRPATVRDLTITHEDRDFCEWPRVGLKARVSHPPVQFRADLYARTGARERPRK